MLGAPALPALGMQAVPNQLALGLEQPVEHGVDVLGLSRTDAGDVRLLTDGGEIRARAAVVATDPMTASSLLGIGSPMMRAQSSWWFAMPVSPTSLKTAVRQPARTLPVARSRTHWWSPTSRRATPRRPSTSSRRARIPAPGHGGRYRDRGRGTHPARPDLPHRHRRRGRW